MKVDKRFKGWWEKASDVEKTEYFERQRRRKQPGKGQARIWDDYQITNFEEQKKGTENRIRVVWMPFDEFETGKLIRGMDTAEIKKEWAAIIRDPKTGAKKL